MTILQFPLVFALTAAMAIVAVCSAPDAEKEISAERRAEFKKEDFDACTLTSPKETWAFWDTLMDDESKNTVRTTSYEDLILFHHGWGRGIRNYFCLWGGGPLRDWFTARGVDHPDSMSMVLIRLYWAHLNGCRPDPDAFARSRSRDTKFLHCPAAVKFK